MTGQQFFFAIQLPAELQKSLVNWRAENFPAETGRPVPAASMLLTLAWLGKISDNTCRRLQLQAARIQQSAFGLTLNDAGHWPRSGVVWLGCRPAPSGLVKLGALLRSQAARQGCQQPTGDYHPHVRLLYQAFNRVNLPPAGFRWQFPVTQFSLMSCNSTGGTRKTQCVENFPLMMNSPPERDS